MKTIRYILSIAALLLASGELFSQSAAEVVKHKSGIYMSPADYLNGQVAYEVNFKDPGHSELKLHEYFSRPYIEVTYNGKKKEISTKNIYAFCDCDGITYRFYNNSEYIVTEAKDICIYIQQKSVPEGDGYKVVNEYYFSTTPSGAIKELTLSNLMDAYPNNSKFKDILAIKFGNGGDICNYDTVNKTYTVNHLYEVAKADMDW